MYSIMAYWANGAIEEIDEAETREAARYLAIEYRLAFGPSVVVNIVSKKT